MDNAVAREGYLALALCILTEYDPDEAFDVIVPVGGSAYRREVRASRHREETEDIIRLKNQGMHAYELAYLFGVTANAIYARIRKHKLRYSGGGQRGTGTRNYLYGMAGAGGCGGQAGE